MPMSPGPRRPLFAAVSLFAAGALIAGCGDDAEPTAQESTPEESVAAADVGVLASTSIWSDVTEQIACGAIDVPSIIPLGVDAHEYEPSVQDADALLDAQLIVVNGLELEEGLEDSLSDAESGGATVIEVGEDVMLVETEEDGHSDEGEEHADDEHADEHADEGHAHEGEEHADDEHADEGHSDEADDHDHGGVDPHVWMDPARVAEAVPAIATALVAVDGLPVDAEQVQQCADDYVAELDALRSEMDEQFSQLSDEQRNLVTNHEALGYLADGFGFEVIGTVIPSTSSLGESNARDLDELAATMQDAGVTRIFGEVTGSTDVADALADRMDGEVEVVALFTESLGDDGSGAETYLEMMRTNAALISGSR
jgi:zinc/manganese transport system substrate-binding protein